MQIARSLLVFDTADTHQTPFDAGSYASATLTISGQATQLAAEAMRDRLLATVANFWQANPAELTLAGNEIHSATEAIDLATLAAKVAATGESLTVEREFTSDRASLTFAMLGVEVEVDLETGRVEVLKCVQALDLGKAINPRICRGQATGGIAMGLGYALSEELIWDDRGCIVNPTPRTYRLPLAKDMPPMEILLVEKGDPFGPFGAKGVGEIGTNCTAPAIANAIARATGVRFSQLPLTPERAWQGLQDANNAG